ncbi:hypothetical protein [Ferrovibrio sp.]|uniref:hypothetical protein n=1 Tax=Ferrovibrio sp. TaxID=1917215 RepID=UPI0035112421
MADELTMDAAAAFTLEYASGAMRTRGEYSSYGYEIYLPNVLHAYLAGKLPGQHEFHGHSSQAQRLSPIFYDAAWSLCRRGILRPHVREIGRQATEDGASGNGYSLTAYGREWLKSEDRDLVISADAGRFGRLIERHAQRFGLAYKQRAEEAARCKQAGANLACCVMCGAAAEAVLLAAATAKRGDNEAVVREYRSASGRRRMENALLGQQPQELRDRFHNLMDLLKYWRDDGGHGLPSSIDEWEADEAVVRLLRLSRFVEDHWAELTS